MHPRLLRILFWLSIYLAAPGLTARACEPYPDYWFNETLTPEQYEPVAGIQVLAVNPSTGGAALFIRNETGEPLYVLPRVAIPQIIQAGGAERMRLAEELATHQVGDIPAQSLDQRDFQALDPDFVLSNPPEFTRPADAPVPPAQEIQFVLVHARQVYTPTFTVSYTWNENFAPGDCSGWWAVTEATETARYQAARQAESQTRQLLAGRTAMILIAVLLPGAIWWAIQKRREPHS